jgi:hypothetical protein
MDDKTAQTACLEYLPEKDGIKIIYAQPPSQISILTTKVVEQHIDALAQLRGQLEPPVPEGLPRDQAVHVTHDPIWLLYAVPLCDEFILHLRHPGHGWLHFVLNRANAGRLALAILNPQDRGEYRDNGCDSARLVEVTDKGSGGYGTGFPGEEFSSMMPQTGSAPKDEIGPRLSTGWEQPLLLVIAANMFVAMAGWYIVGLFFD